MAAVERINLEVGENEFVVLVGPSGCGKSTLLKMVSGLLPVTAGRIQVHGTPVEGPREDVGIVFQAPVLLNWRDVLDNVLFPIEILHRDRRRYRPLALDLIRLVGLAGFETSTRASCRGACSSGWRSAGPSSTIRPCS